MLENFQGNSPRDKGRGLELVAQKDQQCALRPMQNWRQGFYQGWKPGYEGRNESKRGGVSHSNINSCSAQQEMEPQKAVFENAESN